MASVRLGTSLLLTNSGLSSCVCVCVCVSEAGSLCHLPLGHFSDGPWVWSPLPKASPPPVVTWPPGLSLLLLLHFAAWGQQAISHPAGRRDPRALPKAPVGSTYPPSHATPPSAHTVCHTLHVHPWPQSPHQGSEQVTRPRSPLLQIPPPSHSFLPTHPPWAELCLPQIHMLPS